MKRYMTGLLAAACAVALSVGLVACGSSASSSATSASASADSSSESAVPLLAPDDPIDPAQINPGWLDSDVRTSDVWFLNGDTSAEGIFFTKAANDAGLSFTRVDANDEEGESLFSELVITEDKHLTTTDSADPKIDIVFDDAMTCYDYVSGNFYIRGYLDELTSMLAGNTYASTEGKSIELKFNDDGTYEETVEGKTETGTWEVVAATVVDVTYDSDGYVDEYRLTIDNGEVPQVMDRAWKYYDLVK